jgi:DNA-binding transcriptional LysR family regulator
VNQSTVGRRLEALEERLGVRLFLRAREGYSASPAGERLLPRAERMEEEAHAIARELVGQQGQLTGRVRVTSTDAFGPRVVAPILIDFRARHPGIDIEFDADNRLLSLTRREADVAVRFSRPPDRHLVSRKAVDFASAPYCSASYAARRGRPRAPYARHDFVSDLEERFAAAKWIAEHAARGGGRVTFKSSSTFALLQATQAGLGIAMLSCYIADPEPDLVRVGPPEPAMGTALWLVVHRDLHRAPHIRACVDFLAQRLSLQSALLAGRSRVAG